MNAHLARLQLQAEIKSLVDSFQERTGCRVFEINVTDNGFYNGKPVESHIGVETEDYEG